MKRIRSALAVIALLLSVVTPSFAATIVIDDPFPGSGGVPAGWSTLIPGGTISHSDGLLTMSTPTLHVIANGTTFNPAGTTITLQTSIVSFQGRINETAFGSTTGTPRFGFLLTDSGQVGVYWSKPGGCPPTSWNGTTTTLCILSLPPIPGYSGGSIEVKLTVDAAGFNLSTNTGYDSGPLSHAALPGSFSFALLPASSSGFLAVINAGAPPGSTTTSTYDRYRLFAATGADAQTISGTTTASATVATTTLTVTSTGSVNQTGGTTTVLQTMTVDADGNYTLSGGTLDASTIDVSGTFAFTGGTLSVDELQGDLTNQGGTLSPGNSPGLTEITGNYDQQSAGALLIELAGLTAVSEYDRVVVGGTATLGGLLDVDLLYGFAPTLGNSFDILLAEVLSGTFGSVLLPTLSAGLMWQLDYLLSPTGTDVVRLSVVQAVPLPAAVWLFGGALGALGWLRKRVVG